MMRVTKKLIKLQKRLLARAHSIPLVKRVTHSYRHASARSKTGVLGSVFALFMIFIYLLYANHSVIAAGSWTQTDWSGGQGASAVNQYSTASNIETITSAGKMQLSKTEKLSNGGFESDLSGWNTTSVNAQPGFVQTATNNSGSTSVTSINSTFSSTPTSGNMIFGLLAVQSIAVVTLPSGFVTDVDYRNDTTNTRIVIFHKVAGSSESSTVGVTTSIARIMNLDIYEFSNILPTSPLDVISTIQQSTNTSSITLGPTAATNQANELALGMASWSSSIVNPIWDNSFTRGAPVGTGSIFATSAYKLLSTSQTVTSTVTPTSGLRTGSGVMATFKTATAIDLASRDASQHYDGSSSAKVRAISGSEGAFTQSINTGDTNSYNLEAYVYTNGSAVTASDAALMVNGSNITTSYSSVGGGWYKLSGTTTGSLSAREYGVKVKAGKTLYIDGVSLNKFASTGTLTSNIYDTTRPMNWGTLSYTSTGTVQVKARSSNSATMSGAPAFSTCTAVSSGSDISTGTGGCVTDTQRYVQYEITLSTLATDSSSELSEITINFNDSDTTTPSSNATNIQLFKSNGGTEVSEDDWSNASTPYFTWTPAEDDVSGLGIKGYCLYLGQDQSANPVTAKGLLGTSPLDTEGTCPFAISGTEIDLSTVDYLGTALETSSDPYYLNIKAFDYSYNIYGSSVGFGFKFDNTPPRNPAYITAPSNFISSKTATLTWATSGDDAAFDDDSGLTGLQYKIGSNGTWYGDVHNGTQNESDLLTNDGSYTTQSTSDFDNLTDGNNVIYFRSWDNAGNVTSANVTTVLKINTAGSPSSPRNVTASPSSNTQNSFAFSWLTPASFVGQANNLTYCYTVNTQPTEQTCSYTAAGVTSLPAAAFATQPGTNTFYVVAKDESGSINYATAASVDFTANTSAPGMPLNLDIADTSVKASNNWRLVISWSEPDDTGAGVSKYQIFRSTDNNNFSLVGSTSGESYVDTNLQSVEYFYKIKACDSANNCGAFSAVESKTPTGRYTTPPELSAAPKVESVSTKKATINWNTDRNADSKVAFGVSSGNYFPTESYNSTQTKNHTIALSNLDPGTTYFYVVRWTDEDGNTGQSSELSFATLPRPVVEDVTVPNVSLNNATVQYTTVGASKVKLYYGKSSGFGGLVELNTSINKSTYNSSLPDLEDSTKYFYKINTIDSDGNEYEGTTLTFNTPPAPKIVNLQFQPIENEPSSSQKVTWETNVPATSELAYGITGLSENSLNTSLVTKHEVVIRNLKDDSQYRLVARSRDGSGNLVSSDEQLFKTALDTRPPLITDVVVDGSIRGSGAEARGQIVVSWRTDEPATSQVAYGEGAGGFLSNSTSEDARLTYEHVVVISDLSTSRVYHVEPRSTDNGKNQSQGEQQVAIIGRPSDSVLGIIVKALQQVFGIEG